MVKGKTQTGFDFEYNERILDSVRFRDALLKTRSRNGNTMWEGYQEAADMLIGKDGREKLYKLLEKADPDGIATINAFDKELGEILDASKKGKNS